MGDCRLFTVSSQANAIGDCKQSLFALYANATGDRRHFTVSSLANAMGDADPLLLAVG